MSFSPISGAAIQYMKQNGQVAEGYYLKFYIANSTTPLSMATAAAGDTLLVKCKLNDKGYPITNPLDNSSTFIPHVNQAFRFVLYKNETDADNDDTAAADINLPAVAPLASLSQGISADFEVVATAGNQTFAVDYTVGFVRVLYNGVYLPSTDYTATNGSSITLAEPVANTGDVITFLQVTYSDVELTGIVGQTVLSVTYTVGKIRVLYNGVYLSSADYTATDGTTIVLDEAVINNDDVITIVRLI